ncbi:hypothetical protein SynPROS91_00986 [Synechococcus sp. PROS-9-1]|nr:hypothetical protein SynPROS91_00986 [Synechococcus sp. PROS-9-1]
MSDSRSKARVHFLMLYILPPVKKCQIFQIDESTKSAFQT